MHCRQFASEETKDSQFTYEELMDIEIDPVRTVQRRADAAFTEISMHRCQFTYEELHGHRDRHGMNGSTQDRTQCDVVYSAPAAAPRCCVRPCRGRTLPGRAMP